MKYLKLYEGFNPNVDELVLTIKDILRYIEDDGFK